jgi:hypothetical protein
MVLFENTIEDNSCNNVDIVIKNKKLHKLKDGSIIVSKVEFISDIISILLSVSNDTYYYYKVNENYCSKQFQTIVVIVRKKQKARSKNE